MKKTLLYHIFAVGLMLIASVGAFAQGTGVNKYILHGVSVDSAANLKGDTIVYLLNLGKYQNATSKNSPYFIGRGQQWGTEIIISNIPLPLVVKKGDNGTYRLKTTVNENGTNTQGYIGFLMDTNDAHAYFDDRGTGDNLNTTFKQVTNADEGRKNIPENSYVYTMSHYQEATGDHIAGTYYAAALYHPHGTDNPNREDHVNGFTEEQLQDAKVRKDSTNYVDNNDDLWMIITEQQLKNYFSQVDAAQNDPAIATFLIKDPDFARADTDIKNWKDEQGNSLQKDFTRNSNDINARFGPRSKWYFSSNTNSGRYNGPHNYYVGNGWHTDANNDATTAGQRLNGGKWTANILGRGKVYQDVSLAGLRGGWYAVRVAATTFRNETAGQDQYVKLFATSGNKTEDVYVTADSLDPERFTLADSIVNDGKHQSSVLIYINGDETSNVIPANTNLRIGIDATDSHLNNDDDVAARAWTCFDNFQLYYLGDPTNKVLLNEDSTSINYINTQNTFVNNHNKTDGGNGTRAKSTVYLRRAMNAGTWNTLVLPFSIEDEVVMQTFGSGTVYAALEGATDEKNPTTIYFNRELDGIQKGTLYIIRPTNSQPDNVTTDGDGVVFSTSNKDGSANAYNASEALLSFTKGTDGKNPYWTFESVDFGNKNSEEYKPDVYTGNNGKETYKEGQVYFAGTYISHGDTLYIPEKSYVLSSTNTTSGNASAGSWYYRGTKKTKTKGFRGWLQTNDPKGTATTSAKFYVDGELWQTEGFDNTTGIDNIAINGMKVVIRDENVYNLQGQRIRRGTSLEGLPKGIYIVNGKKVLVK